MPAPRPAPKPSAPPASAAPDTVGRRPVRPGWPGVVLTLLLPLAACTTPAPADNEPFAVDIPAAWSAPGASAAIGAPTAAVDGWWQRFDDPMLDAWVQRALRASPRILAADAAWRQALARRDAAAADLAPVVDANASAQTGSSGGDSTGQRYQIGLGAAWVPDVFGARRAARDAAEIVARKVDGVKAVRNEIAVRP